MTCSTTAVGVLEPIVQVLAGYVGSCIVAELALGFAIALTIFLAIALLLTAKGEDPNPVLLLLAGGGGVVVAYGLGLFPLWIPVFLGLIAAFMVARGRMLGGGD